MATTVSRTIRVRRPVAEVFSLWADFESFPLFMNHIKSVRRTGAGLTHWVMKGPAGLETQWDARTTDMTFGRRIAWETQGGFVEHMGEVLFNDIGDETEMTVTMNYVTPLGRLGDAGTRILADPEGRLEQDLENFKRFCERGDMRKTA